ncbi:MAG: tight adherence protein [Acidimicrobiaceae bacterium]|jgi:tight adherence protein C
MSELLARPGIGMVFAVVTALGLSALVAGAGLLVIDRISLRAKLRNIDDLYRLVGVRDQELMLPFVDRVSEPAQKVLSRVGRLVSPSSYAERVRIMMLRAGRMAPGAADRFMALRALSLLAAPVVAVLLWAGTASLGTPRYLIAGLGVAVCVMMPTSRLSRAVDDREKLVRRQLPDIMDLLVICMEAGLGFSAAVTRTVANVEGEMAEEFGMALGEMRAGASRSEALKNLAERVQIPEVQSFVLSIRQADEFGISVSTVLRNQAEEMRVHRRQLAQEKAQKAPVKMLIPMVFCVFPPLFMIVIGPAALQLMASGAS